MFRLLIVEGPAGSGKSTLCKAFESTGVPVIRSSLGKRSFAVDEAAYASSVNDYLKITEAIRKADEGFQLIVIDRLMLSQLVYHQLRTSWSDNEPDVTIGLTTKLHNVWSVAARDLRWRLPSNLWVIGDVSPRVSWLILLPEPDQLHEMRQNGGKKYPWGENEELDGYRYAKLKLFEEMFADVRGVNLYNQDLEEIAITIRKTFNDNRSLAQWESPHGTTPSRLSATTTKGINSR